MSERPIRLVIADDDPIFRLGLSAALRSQPHWQVAAAVARADLQDRLASLRASAIAPSLLLLEPLLPPSAALDPVMLCQGLRQHYPDLPILLLSGSDDPRAIAALQPLGIAGYCPKGTPTEGIVAAIQQVLAGEAVWPAGAERATGDAPPLTTLERAPTWLLALRRRSLGQIEQQLAQIAAELERDALTNWDWLFWRGRQRELRVARWLVQQLLPVEVTLAPASPAPPNAPAPPPPPERAAGAIAPQAVNLPARRPSRLDALRAQLQLGSVNRTGAPLEIDILQPAKRQELLYLTLRQLENLLAELEFLAVTADELRDRQPLIRRELWQNTALAFTSKYYTPATQDDVELVERLVAGFAAVETAILSRIPLLPQLLSYLLYDTPLTVDNVAYRPESPEAQARAELLLSNLTVQIANAVMQFLLNQFAEAESVKYSLYARPYLSSREIARFRNDLSWHDRQNFYLHEPRAIFESQYRLFELRDGRLQRTAIYAPRLAELEQLRGLRWAITIAWEARDAIAPRLRSLIAWLGSGVVYALTHVLGKAIGLIGRGALQGLGNAVQESRYRKK